MSPPPYIVSGDTVERLTYTTLAALLPAVLVSIHSFGRAGVRIIAVSIIACLAFEAIGLLVAKRNFRVLDALGDGTAVVTGLLLALNLPATFHWRLVPLGAFAAVVIAKHAFGGLGRNLFNPAICGLLFLRIAFPGEFAASLKPCPPGDMLLGNTGGGIGEAASLALLLGLLILLVNEVISWAIPFTFVGTVLLFSGIAWRCDPDSFMNPWVHLFSGGLLLGAFFMATDPVTSPITAKGRLIFGFGCGLIAVLIRFYSNSVEGVIYAIFIMNAVRPLIDRYVKPKRWG